MKPWLIALLAIQALCVSTIVFGKEVRRMEKLTITSSAFVEGTAIAPHYTCEGDDVSPPLTIGGVPAGAKSLALIMDDPDAPGGMWVHWVVWNIPPNTREISGSKLPAGAKQGKNGWKRNSYGGPCPPSGTHRYFFKMYALDTTLNLSSSATKTDLERAMHGHILAAGQIMGTYKRR